VDEAMLLREVLATGQPQLDIPRRQPLDGDPQRGKECLTRDAGPDASRGLGGKVRQLG